MTLFKKSLALVLTIAMIFSTMSIMGYAANDGSAGIQYFVHMNADGTIGVDNGSNGIEFQFKFFIITKILKFYFFYQHIFILVTCNSYRKN